MANVDRVGEVVRHFEQAILSGRLAPGELLPPERSIKEDLKVSRSAVREALSRLASMGLVRTIHGSGTRVEPPSPRPIADAYQRLLRQGQLDLVHLAQVRLPLETTIAGLAAHHRQEEHLARLEQAQQILSQVRAGLDVHVRADLEFHATLAEASGNPLFGLVLAPMQELLIESRRRTLGRHGSKLAYEHHAVILQAVRAGDPDAAVEAMRRHLETNVRHLNEGPDPVNEP
jgi:GntR family transcriptional repressor for pyruvate dehydrogenase complex